MRALAARLADEAGPGDRVALLCPQGLEYVTVFLAALSAVPLYAPGLPGHADRLAGVLADAWPSVVVTTSRTRAEVTGLPRVRPPADRRRRRGVRRRGPGPATVAPAPGTPAYLQYASGSTSTR
ncbi:AMP-binding protein [Streptomyces massasporeus]